MSITPWYVAQQTPVWTVTFTQKADNGTLTALNLTGATVTGRMALINADGTYAAGAALTGTITVTNAASGIFTYAPSGTDAGTAGKYVVQFLATFAGGPAKCDPIYWEIRASV